MQTKRQVLFVRGGGERVHDDWDSKLVESLRVALGPSYEIRYPRMPYEDDPSYATWKATLEKEFAALNDGAILVGHSIGGTILIHALAENPPEREFGAIILIAAPFVGEGGCRAMTGSPSASSAKSFTREFRSISTMVSPTTQHHRHTLNCMRTRFHRRIFAAWRAAIISSTMT
jgi:predicted alpha/beta hydrolase family esterase